MFSTTPACPAITKKGLKKLISIFFFVFVFIANINLSPANARFLTSATGTELNISNNSFDYERVDNDCGSFAYLQRVIINGQTLMVLTEFIYPAGTHQMTLVGNCDGLNLYEAGTCSCFNTRVIKFQFFPTIELGIPPKQELEIAPKQILNGEKKSLVVAPRGGELWIRENC